MSRTMQVSLDEVRNYVRLHNQAVEIGSDNRQMEFTMDQQPLTPQQAEAKGSINDWINAKLGTQGLVADLSGLDLSRKDLTNADFSGAIMRGTNLTGAFAPSAKFNHADMTDARLDGMTLNDAEFTLTTLTGASVRNANFKDAKVRDIIGTPNTNSQLVQDVVDTAQINLMEGDKGKKLDPVGMMVEWAKQDPEGFQAAMKTAATTQNPNLDTMLDAQSLIRRQNPAALPTRPPATPRTSPPDNPKGTGRA